MTGGVKARAKPRLAWIRWGCCLLALSTLCQGMSAAADAVAPSDGSSAALSVAPAGELRYPEERPTWIDTGPSLSGKVHRWPVSSSPSSTVELSRRALEVQLRAAAETYLETLLNAPEAPAVIPLSDDWIAGRVDPDRSYEGEIYIGGEVHYEAATELRFHEQDRAWIQSQWASHRVGRRLVGLGVMATGGTLLLLITAAGLSIVARRAERA